MVDDETHISAGPDGAPPNRNRRPDPGVIEGEIAASRTDDGEPRAAAPESTPDARPSRAAEPPRGRFGGVLAGAIAGLVVSLLAIGAFYSLLAPSGDDDLENRLAALETQSQQATAALDAEAKRESAAVGSLDKRVSALEAGAGSSSVADLDKRVAALEKASADSGSSAAAAAQAAQQAAQGGQQVAT